MAITANQRDVALEQILAAAITEAGIAPLLPLATLLPGVTPTQVLSALITGLGTSQDTTFTTALANMVAEANGAITALNQQVTAEQANVTAWTVV